MTGTKIDVLLVEDDPGDVGLIKEALQAGRLLLTLAVVEHGERALAYLHREPPYAQAVRPDLILLDLNLPRKDGREVLQALKTDAQFKMIPVVVLTTSDADADILKAYNAGANCYLTKPMEFHRFADVVKSIESFWFSAAKLPPKTTGVAE